MTQRLYSNNPYQESFEAKVERINGSKVWLNQTCFYPESGGQAGDTGTLNGEMVFDVRFDNDKNIIHIMDKSPGFQIGDTIKGEINWERRHKIMRLHAASHIMEYFLFEVFGKLKLTGSHVNEKHDSSTYETENMDRAMLSEVEQKVNAFIARDLPIETWPDPERPHFRYWKCGEIQMPCGGTHPRNTNEIGPIKLKRKTGGRGREKVLTSFK